MNFKKIIDYYNQCNIDYRILWRINRNLSIHYGFHDKKHKKHDDAVINMNRVLARMAKIKSNDRILDAGCGIGGSSIWLAKKFGSEVVGINISKDQLETAKKSAKNMEVGNLTQFLGKNFADTKFPRNSFDVVWGLESICYAENKKDFLSEARRILKNKGRIIVADGFIKKSLTDEEEGKMNNWLDGWAVPNLAGVNEFKKYLEELGFNNIEFKDITKNVMPSSARLYMASIFGYPIGKLLEWAGIRTKIQTKNIISAYYQHITLKRGLWLYGIFYAEK